MSRSWLAFIPLLIACAPLTPAEQARRDRLHAIEEQDEMRRAQTGSNNEMRCASIEVFPLGVQPQRPYRVIGPVSANFDISSDGAYRTLRKRACDQGADAVLGMSGQQNYAGGGPTYGVMTSSGTVVMVGGGGRTYTTYSAMAIAYLDNASGPRGQVRIDVVGPESSTDKAIKCLRTIQSAGSTPSKAAPVRAVLHLQDGRNSIQVISSAKGVVLEEPRPDWDMERLCDNAVAAVLEQQSKEGLLAVPQPQLAPQRYYGPPPVAAPHAAPIYGQPPPGVYVAPQPVYIQPRY